MMMKTLPLWLVLALLAIGCGVKTSLVPPDVRVPKAIKDLHGAVKGGAYDLTWSIPKENMDGSTPADLVRFQVLRRVVTNGCLECPGEFQVRAELDLRSAQGYLREDNTITWQDNDLNEGVYYIYKVISINHWGYPSPPSNEVVIQWGAPALSPSGTQPEKQQE
jgi:hypothetical protein